PHLLLDSLHRRLRRVPCHGAGVSQTQVHISMSIHVVEMRALRLAHKRGEGPGPLCHPVHGHAAKERLARALEQRFGFGALIYKALLLALHEGLQADAGNGVHDRAEILTEPRDVWARAIGPAYRSKPPSRLLRDHTTASDSSPDS